MPLQRRLLQSFYARVLTSPATRQAWRAGHDWLARALRQPPPLRLWLRLDDPEAFLLVRLLPPVLEHYGLDLGIGLLPSGRTASPTEVADAWHMAQLLQLDFHSLTPPNPADCLQAERILLGAGDSLDATDRLRLLRQLTACVWEHQAGKLDTLALRFPPLDGEEALARLTAWSREADSFHAPDRSRLVYGGEHFVGVADLPDLMLRLQAARPEDPGPPPPGLPPADSGFLVTDPEMLAGIRAHRYRLDFYFCFRDPYSYLSLGPVLALADHYSLRLQLLPVTLPADDDGWPPPGLLWRSARAAARQGAPLGAVCLPDAEGTGRCHTLMAEAERAGRSRQMAAGLLQGIWSHGLDLTRRGHRRAVREAAGLPHGTDPAAAPGDPPARANHRAWRQLGIPRLPALHLHAGQGIALGGEDRTGVMDMVLADSLNNNNTGTD